MTVQGRGSRLRRSLNSSIFIRFKLIDHILEADPTDTSTKIQSLLTVRHGRLVLEEYFDGFSADRAHEMRAAGKTFAPVLVGLVQQQGAKLSPATLVYRRPPQTPTRAERA